MIWPNRPTCHESDVQAQRFRTSLIWQTVQPNSRYPRLPFAMRTCGYCGSLHPEDLVTALGQGAQLGGSNWKYGWPHKFYLTIPNPYRDDKAEVGSESWYDHETEQPKEKKIYGSAGDYTKMQTRCR